MSEVGINKTVEVRSGEAIDVKEINEFLTLQNVDMEEITNIKQFPGGYSNLTYSLQTNGREYVLRRPPAGAKDIKGGHDMAREFRILTAVQSAGFNQVPTPVFLSETDNFLGQPFYIMQQVDGIIFRATDARQLLTTYPPEVFRKISESLCDKLADLHAIDIEKTGLINIGRPDGYVERQVNGWYKRYKNAQTDNLPDIDFLYAWLTNERPVSGSATLIHNDFKYDNVVLNTDDPSQIKALLDWEMTTVGDPLMDVGTALSYWSEAGDGDFEKSFNLTWLPGNLTRQEFAERYALASGRDVSQILYYYVFGLFKNSVVMQQIYSRFKKGLTTDPRFGNLIFGVQRLSEKAVISVKEQQMR